MHWVKLVDFGFVVEETYDHHPADSDSESCVAEIVVNLHFHHPGATGGSGSSCSL